MRRVLSLLLAVVVLAGCGKAEEGAAPEPSSSPGTVKAMSHADAEALAGRFRDEAVTAIGGPLTGDPTNKLVQCEGRTFAALTYGDVPVPADQQTAALEKLREHYKSARDYTVEPPSTDGSDRGALSVTGPDRVTISAVGDGAEAVRINVATPCYTSDEPL
ncbi:lipoprotein [Dactylosporangium sp. CA-092794]|uniref:lipoprotein n=1 Tax=Dactylosporangium sp. CA-092794 TaxID=3239929 RepID=UPI003D8E0F03